MTTGVQVTPGVTQAATIKKHKMFPVPHGQLWKVPLLHSLLAVRAGEFNIMFDDEENQETEIVDDILGNICTS